MAALATEVLDKHVREEAGQLLKEAKTSLRRSGSMLARGPREELSLALENLRTALGNDDRDALRSEMTRLEDLIDEHLAHSRRSGTREYAESIGIAIVIAFFLRLFVVEAFKIPSGSMIPTMEIGDHIFVNKFIYGLRVPLTNNKFFQFRKPERGEVIVFENPCPPQKDFIKRVVAVGGDTVEVRCSRLYVNGERVDYERAPGECKFWDKDELGRWEEQVCSRYIERVGDHEYSTLHDPGRPAREEELARIESDSGSTRYAQFEVGQDFPKLRPPECFVISPEDDPRTDAQREAARGEIELSRPESQTYSGPCAPQRRYVVPEGHVFVMGDHRHNSSDSRAWGPVPLDNIKGKAMFIWWSHKFGPLWDAEWHRIGRAVH